MEKIKTQKIPISSYIVVHKTRLYNGSTLKQKLQEKFNIIVTDSLQILDDNCIDENGRISGKLGGYLSP